MKNIALFAVLLVFSRVSAQLPAPTYQSVMHQYRTLCDSFPELQLAEAGATSTHLPLHAVVCDGKKEFAPVRDERLRVFIINGIHPGEPEGMVATAQWLRNLVTDAYGDSWRDEAVVVAVPVFNIGGLLNQSSTFRANQNGPFPHGFRGNPQNLDLNRDFAKCDAPETQSLIALIRSWDPDLLIDTHTSNGADYPYTLTLIQPQPDMLGGDLARLLRSEITPEVYRQLAQTPFPAVPYVNHPEPTVEAGIYEFVQTPRYSGGWAALHHTPAVVIETHMLKPYPQRVEATRQALQTLCAVYSTHRKALKQARSNRADQLPGDSIVIRWAIDTTRYDTLAFNTFAHSFPQSPLTQQPLLTYDTTSLIPRSIRHYSYLKPAAHWALPDFIVVPAAYADVVHRLALNGVEMQRFAEADTLQALNYYIADFETMNRPYEGHYLHYNIAVDERTGNRTVWPGDAVINTQQPAWRALCELLAPPAPDGFFAWGFADGVLMQKEYFSDYVFEQTAREILNVNASLRAEFEAEKAANPEFAASNWKQLDFIYKRSPWYEPTHNRVPWFGVSAAEMRGAKLVESQQD